MNVPCKRKERRGMLTGDMIQSMVVKIKQTSKENKTARKNREQQNSWRLSVIRNGYLFTQRLDNLSNTMKIYH